MECVMVRARLFGYGGLFYNDVQYHGCYIKEVDEMGASDLRSAFNSAAPGYSCTMALMDYHQHSGSEWQRLTFCGTKPDGTAFEVKSDLLPPETHLETAARAVAK